jgi:hypothetical protein
MERISIINPSTMNILSADPQLQERQRRIAFEPAPVTEAKAEPKTFWEETKEKLKGFCDKVKSFFREVADFLDPITKAINGVAKLLKAITRFKKARAR